MATAVDRLKEGDQVRVKPPGTITAAYGMIVKAIEPSGWYLVRYRGTGKVVQVPPWWVHRA